MREGTRALLEDSGRVRVVAAVPDATALLRAVDELHPDAVITDIRMPPDNHLDGIVAAHAIRAAHPDVGVVVLSQHLEDDYALELFRHGTAGLAYLLKERIGDVTQVLHAVDEVRADRSVLDPDVVDALIASRMPARAPDHGLTPREFEVLHHMAQGKTNPVHRPRSVPVGLRDRKAHQRDLRQTRSPRGTVGPPPGESRADLPRTAWMMKPVDDPGSEAVFTGVPLHDRNPKRGRGSRSRGPFSGGAVSGQALTRVVLVGQAATRMLSSSAWAAARSTGPKVSLVIRVAASPIRP